MDCGAVKNTAPVFGNFAEAAIYPEGSFSIINWNGYPAGAIKPSGPFIILEGAEYQAARDSANQINRILHDTHPWAKGLDIHEIQPVKFGGSPIDVTNKMVITRQEHNLYNSFWRNIQKNTQKGK